MPGREVTVSVVSHGQNALVNALLGDLQRHAADRIKLLITENVPDAAPLATGGLSCSVEIIANSCARGFGANHNAAFERCATPYFLVMNPDIRVDSDFLAPLLPAFADPRVGVAGPLVRSPAGRTEDSVRRFPTAASLLRKLFVDRAAPDYAVGTEPLEVDWLAGMCMLFRSDAYRAVGGFDEGYFLYYEDVDICRRLHARGAAVLYEPRAAVIHDARRASRRNPRLALRHLASMFRYLRRGAPPGGSGNAA